MSRAIYEPDEVDLPVGVGVAVPRRAERSPKVGRLAPAGDSCISSRCTGRDDLDGACTCNAELPQGYGCVLPEEAR